MKKVILFSVINLLFMFALVSITQAFQNEPEGFRGLKWGDPPGEDMEYWEKPPADTATRFLEPDLFPLGSDDVLWYKRKNDKLQIGVVELEYIYYLFYKNKFMEVRIRPNSIQIDSLKDVLKLKFGSGEYEGKGTMLSVITWSGDITTIIVKSNLYERYDLLKIRSTKIYNQYQEDERRQEEEEARRKEEERQKAAEEGLADFDYIPETKKEKKESNTKEKLKTEKSGKVIFNGEEVSDEEKIKPGEPEVQPFFDLSTPENTVRSFNEAIMLEDDSKKAAECWSRRTPEFFIMLLINRAQRAFREGFKEEIEKSPEVKSMIQNSETVKFGLNLFSYEKEQIDGESFYVWYVAPNGSNSKEDLNFRVVKEDGDWKILMLKGMEDIPLFSNSLEKVEASERKFKDFSTPGGIVSFGFEFPEE